MCPPQAIKSKSSSTIQNQDAEILRAHVRPEEIEADIRCIYISGRLDILGVNQIESTFTALASEDGKSVIVDLSRVELMNSVGLGLLIASANTLEAQGRTMVLLKPRPRIKRIIEIAGLDGLLPVEYDLSAAVKRIRAKETPILSLDAEK